MIEQKQLYLHQPGKGLIGDCFRTCVACIMDMMPEQVPHWVAEFWDNKHKTCDTELVVKECNKWLRQFGYGYLEFPIGPDNTIEQLRGWLVKYTENNYVIVGCTSANGGHAVVMKGEDYIWDPAQDNSGCKGPMSDGYFWIGLIVKN